MQRSRSTLVPLLLCLVVGCSSVAPPRPTPQLLILSGSSLGPAAPDLDEAVGAATDLRTLRLVFPRSGFVRSLDPVGAQRLRDALKQQAAVLPNLRMLVLQGGEADNGVPTGQLKTEIEATLSYAELRTGPKTKLVVIGPIPATIPVPQSMQAVNDLLRAVCEQRAVSYIDALASGWVDHDAELDDKVANAVATASR